eukprot:gene5550-5786_t
MCGRLSAPPPVRLHNAAHCWSSSSTSDVHFLQHGRIGEYEAARGGRYNLDPNIQFFATPPVHGSLATYVDHPVELCYKLPPGLSLEQGAMSAAFGADQVVITDVCQEKLTFAERHYKANTLLIDAKSSPAEVAKQLQKAFVMNKIGGGAGLCQAVHESATAGSLPDVGQAADAVALWADENELASMEYAAPDIVIDCVGVQQTLDTAVRAVAAGGKVVLVGMGAEDITLPAQLMTCKEVDLLGSFRYANTYPLSLNLLSSRRVDVMPLITHRFSFTPKDVAEGFFTAAHADRTGAIKVMFNMEQQPAC